MATTTEDKIDIKLPIPSELSDHGLPAQPAKEDLHEEVGFDFSGLSLSATNSTTSLATSDYLALCSVFLFIIATILFIDFIRRYFNRL